MAVEGAEREKERNASGTCTTEEGGHLGSAQLNTVIQFLSRVFAICICTRLITQGVGGVGAGWGRQGRQGRQGR